MSTLPLSPVSMLCGVSSIFAGIHLLHVLKILQLTGLQRKPVLEVEWLFV